MEINYRSILKEVILLIETVINSACEFIQFTLLFERMNFYVRKSFRDLFARTLGIFTIFYNISSSVVPILLHISNLGLNIFQ